ncbi:deoxycytidylate deaminase [Dehalogenimonas etheniformans]|uniref:Cytidine deaminase n=1 Tax=Dehalogenimonas etheniformans TaxID=1536648 RepID=A0A2P5P6X0_9CHLR|nr:dCMP deaminase family protein [Dehalogenimonas etheniformans]PPD58043.1 cytidine deaminase [Dehalogenimonas etheniformans]QNT75393.1 dCMP deaminase family protein [Dehalogenimonas etheniformans]
MLNTTNTTNNPVSTALKRPNIDEYFLKIAAVVAERSTCRRHHVGAVAVKNKHILTTGYNGAPAGTRDCLELGCLRDQKNIPSGTRHEICRAVHAEQNAIIQAAQHGVNLEGATVYCTHTPCILCAKMLANVRIKRFVSYGKYADDSFIDLFKEVGIEVEIRPRPPACIEFLD